MRRTSTRFKVQDKTERRRGDSGGREGGTTRSLSSKDSGGVKGEGVSFKGEEECDLVTLGLREKVAQNSHYSCNSIFNFVVKTL